MVMVEFYELKPVNFFNLSPEKGKELLETLLDSILNSLSAPASFFITTSVNEVSVKDYIIR